jgi:hypothetical protein
MSLSAYMGNKAAEGKLELASSLRISAEYLAGLKGPSQTLITIEGFGHELQKNKQDRLPPGSSRAPRDLAWPVIRGRDALSGLPCVLVIQAAAVRVELERMIGAQVPAFEPVDGDKPIDAGKAWEAAATAIGGWATESRNLWLSYEGRGKTSKGEFDRIRLALVGGGAAELVAYREAWIADARELRAEAAQVPAALIAEEPAATDPIPF